MIVIDNFCNNPTEVREHVLTLPFTTRGNYPGQRTLGLADASWIPFFEKYLPSDERITWFSTHPLSYNGSFQLCGRDDGASWIHHDMTDWAAILFLTPDAPLHAGVTLYRHVATKSLAITDDLGTVANAAAGSLQGWEVDCRVGNVFNRLVMFRGSRFHKSSMYFGTTPETSRLFQVFFFNTRSPPLLQWSLDYPKVVIVIMSTNRYEYLEKMLASMKKNLVLDGCWLQDIIVIDDYPLKRDLDRTRRLAKRYKLKVIEHDTNRGLPKTWRHAWDIVGENPRYEWVFHVEDDVEFVTSVRLKDMITAYCESSVPLVQLALKRQPCYDDSIDLFVHIREGTHGTEYPEFVTQTRYFMTMASLYPREIAIRCPIAEPQEHSVLNFYRHAFPAGGGVWGRRQDPPSITHLGQISRGIKGPGFEHLPKERDYDFLTGRPHTEESSPL